MTRRERVPVHQNLLVMSAREARSVARATRDIVACADCGFVFNRAFDATLLDYGEVYENTQDCSPAFDAYLNGLARELVERHGVRNARVVEVGCGKGHFLAKLVGYPGAGNRGDGFDPSYLGPDEAFEGRLRFHRTFYGAEQATMPADVVVCRHVIEHVDRPLELLAHVRAALAASPNARVFFETPDVEWILRHRVIQDFFYEHCSLFTGASLAYAMSRAGFADVGVARRFGDQYLWCEARVGAAASAHRRPGDIVALARAYADDERAKLAAWRERLAALAAEGPVAIWGAGAKGATFANLLDPDCRTVAALIDVNPAKQGRFVPGTGHPIRGVEALRTLGIAHAIVMNPNYRAEIGAMLADERSATTLLDWD